MKRKRALPSPRLRVAFLTRTRLARSTSCPHTFQVSSSEASSTTGRANAEWDKITGDRFWSNCRERYARYHRELDVWDYDDTGTLHAVYEFLRGLGVRWFALGEVGEVVPKQATLVLPSVNRTVRPDFALRRLSYFTDHLGLGEVGHRQRRLPRPGEVRQALGEVSTRTAVSTAVVRMVSSPS